MATDVKTVVQTAVASVKTYGALAAASGKTWCGVDMTAGGTSYVTSVQPFSITIGNGETSHTATITSVDTSLAAIFYGGRSTALTLPYTGSVRLELTDATTVTAYRNTADTLTVTATGTVVQFTSAAIQSIQHGYVAIPASAQSATATVSAVTTSNAALVWLGTETASSSANQVRNLAGATLTDSTTVTASFGNNAGAGGKVGFCLVEFKAGIVQSVQALVATTTADTATSYTATISSVTTGNTVLINGGRRTTTNASNTNIAYTSTLTDATTVTFTRIGTSSATVTNYVTVLEFVSGVLASVQRGTISMAIASSSGTSTITSVNTAKSLATWQGFQEDPSSDVLTDATTVTATRGVSSAAGVAGYEVPTFN